jgi:hypothetical protein
MGGRGFSGLKVSMSTNGGCVRLTFQANNLCDLWPIDWPVHIGDVAGLQTLLHDIFSIRASGCAPRIPAVQLDCGVASAPLLSLRSVFGHRSHSEFAGELSDGFGVGLRGSLPG